MYPLTLTLAPHGVCALPTPAHLLYTASGGTTRAAIVSEASYFQHIRRCPTDPPAPARRRRPARVAWCCEYSSNKTNKKVDLSKRLFCKNCKIVQYHATACGGYRPPFITCPHTPHAHTQPPHLLRSPSAHPPPPPLPLLPIHFPTVSSFNQ